MLLLGSQAVLQIIYLRSQRLLLSFISGDIDIQNSQFSSNWDLSTARATATIRLLIRYKLRPERMAAAGYAEFHPIAGNDTPEGRANNRRVDIVVPRKPSP